LGQNRGDVRDPVDIQAREPGVKRSAGGFALWQLHFPSACLILVSRLFSDPFALFVLRTRFMQKKTKVEIRPFEPRDEEALVQLWTDCGLVVPWNNPHRDIQRKLKVQSDMFLVGCLDGRVIASVMAGYDGHRGWINYLAVDPGHQRCGIGKRMMDEGERRLRAAGCPKINLQVRSTNAAVIEFYQRIGFKVDDVVSLGKRLEPDEELSTEQ
jgi:ribosomal protein S18 acetylase RimI-like enzyme